MNALQLPLLDEPKPLLERFGTELFHAVPRSPGVYVMTDGDGRPLYIGQSRNLRERLASYKNARLSRVSRRLARLLVRVRSISWEKCATAALAQVRENELLRLHRPRFNVTNVYPQRYAFVALRADPRTLRLRLLATPEIERGEELFGAFKSRGLVRAVLGALARLDWAAKFRPVSPHEFPSSLLKGKIEHVECSYPDASANVAACFFAQVREFFQGADVTWLETLQARAPIPDGAGMFFRRWRESDLELLTGFFDRGPARNHRLRLLHGLPPGPIGQAELDDLLVLARTMHGARTAFRAAASIPGSPKN